MLSLTLLLVAQFSDPSLIPGERHTYAIKDYVLPEDCTVTSCDLSPAFDRLFAITDAAPAQSGMRAPGTLITLPPGDFRISRPIVLNRGHTIRGAGGGGWGAPTVLRVTTSTHGIIVNPLASWADIGDLALITDKASETADRHGILLKTRAHIHDMWIRRFTVGVYALGDLKYGTNINGARLDNLRIDLQEYAGVYILGDNAGAVVLSAVDVGSVCQKASKWEAYFQGRACAGIMDWSMMGATIVGGQSANARDMITGLYKSNYFLRRTSALGAYSEMSLTKDQLEVDAVVLGGTLAAPSMAAGLGFRLYGTRANQLKVYGTAAVGDTQKPEIWIGGDAQPPGTVLTLMPPQSGSSFPSYSALRTKMDVTPNKRGWRTDLQNATQYTTERILIEPTKPGVVITRTSTKIIP